MVFCVMPFYLRTAEVIADCTAKLSACGCRNREGHLIPWYTSGFE